MNKRIFVLFTAILFLLSINSVFAEQINAEECTSLSVNEQRPYYDINNKMYNIAVISVSENEGTAQFDINSQITGLLRAGDLYVINEEKHLKVTSITGTKVNFCLITYIPCQDVSDRIFENEQKTYKIGNDAYTIKAKFVGSGQVQFIINSETTNIMQAEGSYYSFGEGIPKTKIMLKKVGTDNGKTYAQYCLDSSKIIMYDAPKTTNTEVTPPSGASASDLSGYPRIFLDNNRINAVLVVGDQAPADDVVSAIDIVNSFGSLSGISPTKLASEVNNFNQNIISIGRPCDNKLTAELLKLHGKNYGTDCSAGLKARQALVQLYTYNGHKHMIIFGYSKLETRQAARAVSTKPLSGNEMIFTFDSRTMPRPTDTNSQIICTDSDEGKRPYVKGTTYGIAPFVSSRDYDGGPIDKTDYCARDRTEAQCADGECLVEYFCTDGSNMNYEVIHCENGCENGACRREEANVNIKECVGCKRNGACLTTGIRVTAQEGMIYCDIDGQFKNQKEDMDECQNNYECLSNTCHSGICQNISDKIEAIQKELNEQKGILNKIADFLKRLFNF